METMGSALVKLTQPQKDGRASAPNSVVKDRWLRGCRVSHGVSQHAHNQI